MPKDIRIYYSINNDKVFYDFMVTGYFHWNKLKKIAELAAEDYCLQKNPEYNLEIPLIIKIYTKNHQLKLSCFRVHIEKKPKFYAYEIKDI